MNASNLTSGTVPDARFPATLPAISGANLTNLDATDLTGTIASARIAGSYTGVTGTGALNAGSITSGFGAIDNGSSAITTTGVITGGTLEATTDTAAGDNATIGYTAAEGLILTGQGSTSDITLKNDADATVFTVPTGTDDILFPDSAEIQMGAGADLKVSSDGTNGVLRANNGRVYIQTDTGVNLTKTGNAETMLIATPDGSVDLYYNNSKKIETTSTGATVTGSLGIGTASPTRKLDVHAGSDATPINIRTTQALSLITFDNSSDTSGNHLVGFQGDDFVVGDTNISLRLLSAGTLTLPSQPAFQVYKSSNDQNNIPADNSSPVVTWSTEAFDIGSNFASNTFTAPVTGKYLLTAKLRVSDVDNASQYYILKLVTSNGDCFDLFDSNVYGSDLDFLTLQVTTVADMDANDTAQVQITQQGGTAQSGILGSRHYSNFSGYLLG